MTRIVSAPPALPAPPSPPVRGEFAARVKRAALWPLLGLALLTGGCAWLDQKQREIALRPTPGRPANVAPDEQLFRPGDQRRTVEVPAASGVGTERLALWWLPHADATAPALLYLHGTFRNLYSNMPKIDALRAAGFSVLAVDYRGWGDSTALIPSEATITADAAVAWAELQRRGPHRTRRVIFGHSMGGAVATRLASTLRGARRGPNPDYAALVVESTFTRINDVADEAGFLGRVLALFSTLDFESIDFMKRVDGPVWMLHGDADTTVPVALGRRLRDAVPAGALARWVEIPGGNHSWLHRDHAELYQKTFNDLINSLPAAPATEGRTP
jgi:uncharacterized protein